MVLYRVSWVTSGLVAPGVRGGSGSMEPLQGVVGVRTGTHWHVGRSDPAAHRDGHHTGERSEDPHAADSRSTWWTKPSLSATGLLISNGYSGFLPIAVFTRLKNSDIHFQSNSSRSIGASA